MKVHENFVNGTWAQAPEQAPNINPSNLADVVGEYARADQAQARAAIAAARAALPAWSRGPIQARADMLDKIGAEILARKDELGTLLAREEGKTKAEAVGEATRAGYLFRFFAGEVVRQAGEVLPSVRPGIKVEITREPVGVVGIITPWNFPLAIPAWKIAPALAYGNCVVFKPADLVPGCAWALTEIIAKAGVPAGVFNLIMGRGSVIGDVLSKDPGIEAVSFTGSVAVGRTVAQNCAARLAKVQLEMGGKNPQVVLDDAELDTAVSLSLQSAFFSTGQRCTASSRLIVTEGIHDRFVGALTEKMQKLKVDDALKEGTDIGPVVDERQLEQDLKYIALG
ncbi:MAG TPA: aldehyde dehydrogenase family protein, partial [Burkholderiales bacterium]|nr:aldehyde dehydrogenase family protein [Burkholderiales bacterium]